MGSTVKDVMTTQIVAVGAAASFKEMVVKMRGSRVSALPVIDGEGRPAGLIDITDLIGVAAVADEAPERAGPLRLGA